MCVVKYVVNRIYGNRTKRLYVRLNPCQFAGLTLMARRAGQSEGQYIYHMVVRLLTAKAEDDLGFSREWDRACVALVEQGKLT